jgi:hypothetical protein
MPRFYHQKRDTAVASGGACAEPTAREYSLRALGKADAIAPLMRATLVAVTVVFLLVPAGAWACGQGFRTSPYQNLMGATAGMLSLDVAFFLYDVLPTPA